MYSIVLSMLVTFIFSSGIYSCSRCYIFCRFKLHAHRACRVYGDSVGESGFHPNSGA